MIQDQITIIILHLKISAVVCKNITVQRKKGWSRRGGGQNNNQEVECLSVK